MVSVLQQTEVEVFQLHRGCINACVGTRACVYVHPPSPNKRLVIYGVSRQGVKSSQVRLRGGFKWKRADVGGY